MESIRESEKKKRLLEKFSSLPEIDAARILEQLFPTPPSKPMQRTIRKTIREADGTVTKIEYKIDIDPSTGEEIFDINVSTSKAECPFCGDLVNRLYTCPDCGKRVCANCIRKKTTFFFLHKYVCRGCWF